MIPAEDELARALRALAAAVSGEGDVDVDEAMSPLLRAALATLPGAQWTSLTARRSPDRPATTLVASAEPAAAADEIQYRVGEGPCLEATAGSPVLADRAVLAERYPRFAAVALEATPIRAVLSYPVPPEAGLTGSVNFYSASPTGFDVEQTTAAARAAASVGVAYAALAQRRRADNLHVALATSRQIAAAIGILMARHQLTYERAFDLMRSYSQRTHTKMRDLAEEVLLIGMLPRLPAVRSEADGQISRSSSTTWMAASSADEA